MRAALSERDRARTQRQQRDRLRDGLDLPLVELPYVFAEQLGPDQLASLADVLEGALP